MKLTRQENDLCILFAALTDASWGLKNTEYSNVSKKLESVLEFVKERIPMNNYHQEMADDFPDDIGFEISPEGKTRLWKKPEGKTFRGLPFFLLR